MTGFYPGDPTDSATLDAMGSALVPSSTSDVLGAAAAGGLAANPTPRILRAIGRDDEAPPDDAALGLPGVSAASIAGTPEPEPPQLLQPDEANAQYGIKGALSFSAPVTQHAAQDLYDAKKADALRADVIARGPGGLLSGAAARTGLGFLTGLLDPLNLAAGVVPGVPEAKLAALFGDGLLGTTAARALAGASGGAAAMAALEPANYLLDQQEHNDWSMVGALSNIAFGGALGGGLHVIGGAIGDALRAPNPITRQMAAAGPDARDMALNGAVGQLADGRPVQVAPALDLLPTIAPTVRARPEAADGNYATYTPDGMRVEAKPEIVSAADLIASHTDDGTFNPDFPHAEGMQPRDRTSIASQAQIAEMAARIEPSRLGPSPEAGNGAPIVDAGNVVESGNGRTLALRRMYADPQYADQAQAYRGFLAQSGYDTEGVADPVLVGRRQTELTPEQSRQFAVGANERSTLAMTATEQARIDATRAGRALHAFQPGRLDSAGNGDFRTAFLQQAPKEERGALQNTDGSLSGEGMRRITSGLLAYSYGDSLGPTLESMLNGDTEGIKAAAGALTDVAGPWAQMRAAAARGDIPPDLDITPAVGEAVQLIDRARQLNRPLHELLAQGDMIGQPSDAALALLRLMFNDDAMTRPVSRPKLAEMLREYAEQSMEASPDTDMFGNAPTTAADILRAIGDGDANFGRAADAMQQLRDAAGRAVEHPDDALNRAANAEAVQRAPAVPSELDQQLGEAQAAADTLAQQVRTEIDAGRLTEADAAELTAAVEAQALAEGDAHAFEAAAACLIGSA